MQRFSVVLVGLTWLLVVLGGIVHNTGSSLACPDWPLCNGSAFPQMVGPVLIEHGHRLTALAVVVGTMILLVWTARARDPGAIKIAGVALALVIVQALLGAITVKLRLPPIVSTGHLATSMLFFSTVIYLAFRLRQSAAPPLSARAQGMTLATAVLIYAQMVLGAAVRHLGAGLVCREWWCSLSGDYPLQLHMAHRIVAALVLIFSVATAVVVFRAGRARLLALALPLLVIAQMTLGLLTITSFRDFVPLTAHLAVAALLFACAVSLHLIARGPLATSSDEVTLPHGAIA